MKKPIYKEQWDKRRSKMRDDSPIHSIDAMFEMECRIALASYHGSIVRAGWHLIVFGIRANLRSVYWHVVYRVFDKIGWTRLQPIPGTPYYERHSGKCDRMNCMDMNCVDGGIPKWFQRATGMFERDEP